MEQLLTSNPILTVNDQVKATNNDDLSSNYKHQRKKHYASSNAGTTITNIFGKKQKSHFKPIIKHKHKHKKILSTNFLKNKYSSSSSSSDDSIPIINTRKKYKPSRKKKYIISDSSSESLSESLSEITSEESDESSKSSESDSESSISESSSLSERPVLRKRIRRKTHSKDIIHDDKKIVRMKREQKKCEKKKLLALTRHMRDNAVKTCNISEDQLPYPCDEESSLHEIQEEYDIISEHIDIIEQKEAIKDGIKMLCKISEKLLNKYDFFGITIDKWTENEIEPMLEKRDRIIEMIYTRIRKSFHISPEIIIIIGIIYSFIMYMMSGSGKKNKKPIVKSTSIKQFNIDDLQDRIEQVNKETEDYCSTIQSK
jgi:hypothetical protein